MPAELEDETEGVDVKEIELPAVMLRSWTALIVVVAAKIEFLAVMLRSLPTMIFDKVVEIDTVEIVRSLPTLISPIEAESVPVVILRSLPALINAVAVKEEERSIETSARIEDERLAFTVPTKSWIKASPVEAVNFNFPA